MFLLYNVYTTPKIVPDGDYVSKVIAICSSAHRQEAKKPLPEGVFCVAGGLEGDSHFGMEPRQVSLLRAEDIAEAEKQAGFSFPPGALAENLVVEGLPAELPPGLRLAFGPEAVLEVVEKGKRPDEPHSYDYKGWCLLPSKGYFLRVVSDGSVKLGDSVNLVSETADSGPAVSL